MKIYTGTGDRGRTSLFSGERVGKDHVRVEAYGDLDELNATLGALRTELPAAGDHLGPELLQIQSDLFHLGAWLATSPDSPARQQLHPLPAERIEQLEQAIDRLQERLPPLSAFILPGGHPAAAWAHVARTVCRRAERRAVALAAAQTDAAQESPELLVYLNRLSDYLFVLARTINLLAGIADTLWQP
jgi:cob(I)alamin adenosyltransferase